MTKLPKKGDEVTWGTSGGETHGTVEKIVTETTHVKGHTAKATKDEPQVLGEERQIRQGGGTQAGRM